MDMDLDKVQGSKAETDCREEKENVIVQVKENTDIKHVNEEGIMEEKENEEKGECKEERRKELQNTRCTAVKCVCVEAVSGLRSMGERVLEGVEKVCEFWGRVVTGHPFIAIFITLMVVGACSLGLLNLKLEQRTSKLWYPQDSNIVKVDEWRSHHFPAQHRSHVLLWESEENVLTAVFVKRIFEARQQLLNVTFYNNGTALRFQDICLRVRSYVTPLPALSTYFNMSGVDAETQKASYCQQVEALPTVCYERSFLEVWNNDPEIIMNLTDEMVVRDINHNKVSPVFGLPIRFTDFFGGKEMDGNGQVVKARVTRHTLVTSIRRNVPTVDDLANNIAIDKASLSWEKAVLSEALAISSDTNFRLVPNIAISMWKESAASIFGDVPWLVTGWVVLIVYALITLGRPCATLVGICSVGLSVAVSYGLCSALFVPCGTVTYILPILLLGLGVDDMYVIVAAWEVASENGSRDLAWVGGRTLRMAGISIMFTSFTDAIAFLVGLSSRLPAISWFCGYAAVGIVSTLFLQSTLFLAALSLHHHYISPIFSVVLPSWMQRSTNIVQRVIKHYSMIIGRTGVTVGVTVVTLLLLGLGCWGASCLNIKYEPKWMLSRSSYLYNWFEIMEQYFPPTGYTGVVFFGGVNITTELPGLRSLVTDLYALPIITNVDAWFLQLEKTLEMRSNASWSVFEEASSLFLHSPEGSRYIHHIAYQGPLLCGHPILNISNFKLHFRIQMLTSNSEEQKAMTDIIKIVKEANITGYHSVYANGFHSWEMERHISSELKLQMITVISVVALMTVAMIGINTIALLVVGCVAAILLETSALMHVLGLTIDPITTIALILAGGLSVDYVAHIAHAYLATRGDRQTRAQAAVCKVGPPVLHACLSTFLAFVILAPSESHLFQVFFKVYSVVSLLGLLYSLIVLPCLLAGFGPQRLQPSSTQSTSPLCEASNTSLTHNTTDGEAQHDITHNTINTSNSSTRHTFTPDS
ncbi:hypothetical protein Pmani_008773 [Petrolisthes manimaculis]|uniref:SSD domain-containing protein n=1 Tax=Petrolisthes manimaculis TaxID=1843537 RepID=A0AAE1UDK1_9EUCA|nr:hypothetical protein Pmani_008773 [Petrolisthes manimaculis]